MAAATTTNKDETLLYRPLQKDQDQDIVWTILMHAAHETDLDDVKSNPDCQPYAENFGHERGDIGIVAVSSSADPHQAVGAAWVRLLPDGFATCVLENKEPVQNMPELAIACRPEHRGQGIGTCLLQRLLQAVKDSGENFAGVCLSCREENPARKLYEKMGFVTVPGSRTTNRVGGTSITMRYVFEDD